MLPSQNLREIEAASPDTLRLACEKPIAYAIHAVKRPLFSMDEPTLADIAAARPVLIVVDKNVDQIYGPDLDEYTKSQMNVSGKLLIDAAEGFKNIDEVLRICAQASILDFPRHGVFIAVGGGITLDVVGLAAALYRRGTAYLRIPTTLVGLIDAGLGIKQGVNFANHKNLLGAFYPPFAVVNDTGFLRTLPLHEISAGLAEIVKMALVADEALFEDLEEFGETLWASRFSMPERVSERVLFRSAELMLRELQTNLYETNLRRLVDFGHTFSPAIEVNSHHHISHGHAVAMDMALSTAIAVGRDLCPPDVLLRVVNLYGKVRLPCGPPTCGLECMVRALWNSSCHRGGNLNLVVPTDIGKATFLGEVLPVELERASEVLTQFPQISHREAYVDTRL